jgi:hypothetical protein
MGRAFEIALRAYNNHKEQHVKKVAQAADAAKRRDELDDKIESLEAALRDAVTAEKDAREQYGRKHNDLDRITKTITEQDRITREIEIAKSYLQLTDRAMNEAESNAHLFAPRPPYAALAEDTFADMPDLAFAVWCFEREHGRIQDTRLRSLLIATVPDTENEKRFKQVCEDVTNAAGK